MQQPLHEYYVSQMLCENYKFLGLEGLMMKV